MYRSTPRAAIAATIAAGCLLATAAAASAAVAVTRVSDLVATGDGANDTIILSDGSAPGKLRLQVPGQALADPDGPSGSCTATGDTVECSADRAILDGGAGDDTLTSTATATYALFRRSDVLIGGDGNDVMTGGSDSDEFQPGPGADKVRGGSAPADPSKEPYKTFLKDGGNPAEFQRAYSTDYVDYDPSGGGVNVTLDDVANDGAPGEGDDIGSDIESVTGTNANDTLTAGAGAVFLKGLAGDDVLSGGPADDYLIGGPGDPLPGPLSLVPDRDGGGADTLNGNAGDDYLVDADPSPQFTRDPGAQTPKPPGADTLNGGPGDDAFTIDAGADDVIGGPGNDAAGFAVRRTLHPYDAGDDYRTTPLGYTISLDDVADDGQTGTGEGDNIHSDVEVIRTGDGGGDDVVTGSAAPNEIDTGLGNDTVDGGGGADIILTSNGDDSIKAQDGVTDRVDAGQGNDSAVADLPGGQPEKADVLFNVENVSGVPLPSVIDVAKIPAPAPPNAPPVLTIAGSTTVKPATFLKTGRFSLRVTTNEPATVAAELLGKARFRAVGDLVLAGGKLPLGTGTRTLKVSVGRVNLKTFKRKLRTRRQRRAGLSFKLRVVATDALGLPSTRIRTVRIKG